MASPPVCSVQTGRMAGNVLMRAAAPVSVQPLNHTLQSGDRVLQTLMLKQKIHSSPKYCL